MNFVVEPFNRLVKIKFTPDISPTEFLNLLRTENFEPHKSQHYSGRSIAQMSNPKLKEISQFLASNENTKKIINMHYKIDNSIEGEWGLSADEMYQRTYTEIMFCKDNPGFTTQVHLDIMRLCFTGVIYFTLEDDPNLATEFYDDLEQNNKFRMTTNFGDGWMQYNSHTSFHQGSNNTLDKERYLAILSIGVNLAKNPIRL